MGKYLLFLLTIIMFNLNTWAMQSDDDRVIARDACLLQDRINIVVNYPQNFDLSSEEYEYLKSLQTRFEQDEQSLSSNDFDRVSDIFKNIIFNTDNEPELSSYEKICSLLNMCNYYLTICRPFLVLLGFEAAYCYKIINEGYSSEVIANMICALCFVEKTMYPRDIVDVLVARMMFFAALINLVNPDYFSLVKESFKRFF
jgi:hypothetical protein